MNDLADNEPDEIDLLEEKFAEFPRASLVSAYITRDPGAPEPQRLPALKLRRDAEAYAQIYEHVLAQTGASSGVYMVRLREGGKYRHSVRLNLLFAGPTARQTESSPQVSPQHAHVSPQVLPAVVTPPAPDYAREVGDRLVRQAIEDLVNPPEYDDEEPNEPEVEDEDEDDDNDEKALSGLSGALVGLGKAFLESEGGKELLGDFFSAMSEERRANAKKLTAEADAIRSRVRPGEHSESNAISGLGEVLKFRIVEEEESKAAGGEG